ncbi:MAG: FG-GAP-like repeat-containing protein [Ignavibacteria bacterium]|nr:FG-GAP-like repeat-containing protein [Ignavibacteria bacterium]
MKSSLAKAIVLLLMLAAQTLFSQTFRKVTDQNNPIVSDPGNPGGSYTGAAWIDFNNDGLLDLYSCRKSIYKNLGGGNFVKLNTALNSAVNVLSTSWADYNNDGFIDCYVVSTVSPSSALYKNNGDETFTRITSGAIGDSAYSTGWGCTWGDYNNDGYADLVIAAANSFGIVNHPTRFFHNNGDGTFTKIDSTHFALTLAPYTVPTFSDYDMDGDMDLFIGSGPAGSLARDFNYRNLLTETSLPYLKRLDTGILGTDLVDGQNYSFIDYDNDGDLDAYLTNYRFGTPNNLYRNEGNGFYTKMTSAQVGRIASDSGSSLSNTWADFDNDGDIDCYVTNDNSFTTRYYNNNGDGTFTRVDSIAVRESGPKYGAVAGDYDNDGDVDLYVSGAVLTKALYENITNNGNKWVNIKCTGINANRSAIGARVKVKAVINGQPRWQMREVNSQNSFNSMNMLNVHFGLGNATIIDSMVVEWPRGGRQVFTGIALNTRYNLIEGMSLTTGTGSTGSEQPGSFRLGQNFPNPFNPQTKIEVDLTEDSKISLEVFDLLGRKIGQIAGGRYGSGRHIFAFDANGLSSGVYLYKLTSGSRSETRAMTLLK